MAPHRQRPVRGGPSGSPDHPVLQVRGVGSVDHVDPLELDVLGVEPIEQPQALAHQHGQDVQAQLVQQAGAQELLDRGGAPSDVTLRSPAAAVACASALSMPSVTNV